MTAQQKIEALRYCLMAFSIVGRMPNEDGTLEENILLLKVAMLGCAMGQVLLAGTEAPAQDEGQSTVTE